MQIAQAQAGPPIRTPSGAQPLPTAPAPAPSQATDTQAAEEPIGNVATLTGKASVRRNDKSIPLALKSEKDPISFFEDAPGGSLWLLKTGAAS